tara:strand:- start:211 stop:501 length:291 start_codon:yes stop_codon:yes gene_type:complete
MNMDIYKLQSDEEKFKILLNSVRHSREPLNKIKLGKIDRNLLMYINLMHSATHSSFEEVMKKLLLLEKKINKIEKNVNNLYNKFNDQDEDVQYSCW